VKPLHEALREARIRAGLTQTQAANMSGVSRGTIYDIESQGKKSSRVFGVGIMVLRDLAETYGCTVSELIGEVPPPKMAMNVRERIVVNIVLAAMRTGEVGC
jgi:transcriptional regulator with XRE-family HTH domain